MRKALLILFLVVGLLPCNINAYTHDDSLIHWLDYSGEAFEKAKKENKPIFMLITAVWCYNCHIYETKTIETEAVAAYINKYYIPVFVDYDRRKDVARTYPAVGIPVTVVFAPNGEELVSVPGYIPVDILLANLKLTLKYIAEEFEPSAPLATAEISRPLVTPTESLLWTYMDRFSNLMQKSFDPAFGGFGLAQKQPFADVITRLLELGDKRWNEPVTNTLEYMLGLRQQITDTQRPSFEKLVILRETEALGEVDELQTSDKMAGIYDVVEGGFFRYATRRNWTVPHYEKMLFENAQLIDLFLAAYRATGDKQYKTVAEKSLHYLLQNLYDNREGRFLGSQTADEVYYHLTAKERSNVVPPPVDKTSYALSSARAIIAFLNASQALEAREFLKIARKGLAFLENTLITREGALSYYDPVEKKGRLNGQLADNAWVALALITAYEITGDKKYLATFGKLTAYAMDALYDPESGGFFERRSTSREFYPQGKIFIKDKPFVENGVMAKALLKAHEITGNKDYLMMAEGTVGYFFTDIEAGHLKAASPHFHWVAERMLATGKYQ